MTRLTADERYADELRRAELWQEQQGRRVAFQSELWASLAGDPDAYWQLVRDWSPLISTDVQWTPPEDDPGFDPLGISDSVNVGT